MSHADTSTRTIKNSSPDALATLSCHATLLPSNQKIFSKIFMSSQAITSHHTPSEAPTQGNKLTQAANKLTSSGSATSVYKGVSASCRACMTRTPPNVRRRLTGGAQVGPGEGILRHTQGQNKTSCRKCFPEVSGLTDHQAQMPQHESRRHIHEDYQEFIFGCISNIIMSCNPASIKPKNILQNIHVLPRHYKPSHTVTSTHTSRQQANASCQQANT